MSKPTVRHDYFSGKTDLSVCIRVLYRHLMTREWITYERVFPDVWEEHIALLNKERKSHHEVVLSEEEKFLPSSSYSTRDKTRNLYKALKKAKDILYTELQALDPASMEPVGKLKKGEAFRYVGAMDDPLESIRDTNKDISQQRGFRRYMQFCKNSTGLIPAEWVTHFLGNRMVADIDTETALSSSCISADINHRLHNIHLLPRLYEMIINQRVIRFTYRDFNDAVYHLIFHPQYLREFEGRWQLFGETDDLKQIVDRPFYNIALDRIEGEITYVMDVPYRQAPENRYFDYFHNLVGVTQLYELNIDGERVELKDNVYPVRVRALKKYMFGLLKTKPIYRDQQVVQPWDDRLGYGEFEMQVHLNHEFFGKILQMGADLQIVAPDVAVRIMQTKVNALSQLYS